jgi:hypothetical protein
MENTLSHNTPCSICYLESREAFRHTVSHILAITSKGVGRVLTINRHGFSFGCLYPHSFADNIHLDLLDAAGNHIKKVPVHIVWQKQTWDRDAEYEVLVGAEFTDLSDVQREAIDALLADFDCIAL